jgi:hypothetical protein
MEEEDTEAQAEEEAEGGGGLYRHADLYQKALGTFLDDATLNAVFMDRYPFILLAIYL